MKAYGDLLRALDDVMVCNDIAIGTNHEARAQGTRAPPLWRLLAPAFEKISEKLLYALTWPAFNGLGRGNIHNRRQKLTGQVRERFGCPARLGGGNEGNAREEKARKHGPTGRATHDSFPRSIK